VEEALEGEEGCVRHSYMKRVLDGPEGSLWDG